MAIVERMMAKEPADRFATPGAVAAALAPLTAGCELPSLLTQATGAVKLASVEARSASTGKLSAAPHTDTGVAAPGSEPAAISAAAGSARVSDPAEADDRRSPGTAEPGPHGSPGRPAVGSRAGSGDPRPTGTSRGSGGRRLLIALAVAAAALPLLIWGGWIIIRVLDDKGNVVSETRVAGGHRLEIEQDGKPVATIPLGRAATKLPATAIQTEPLVPLSPLALVAHPTKIDGLTSWTIETVESRGPIRAVAPRPGSPMVATGGTDGTIRLWELPGRRLHGALLGHEDGIESLAWSPDGKRLASGGLDRTVRIWDLEAGRCVGKVGNHLESVSSVAWSTDGGLIAVATSRRVSVWHVDSGEQLAEIPGEAGVVAWSPDAKTLACGATDRLTLIDTASWKERHGANLLAPPSDPRHHLAWSPDGSRIAELAERRNTVHIFTAATATEERTLSPASERSHRSDSNCGLGWSPDGKLVAVAEYSGWTTIWDPATGQERALLASWSDDLTPMLMPETTNPAWYALGYMRAWGSCTPTLAWAPDGRTLALSAAGIQIWDIESARLMRTLDGSAIYGWATLSWSDDQRTIASPVSGRVHVWDPLSGQMLNRPKANIDFGNRGGYTFGRSRDGRLLVGRGQDELVLVNPEDGSVSGSVRGGGATISPDGTIAVTDAPKAFLEVWDPQLQRIQWTVQDCGHMESLAWSPDGQVLGGIGQHCAVVWDGKTGRQLARLDGEQFYRVPICWSDAGQFVIFHRTSRLVEFRDPRTLSLVSSYTVADPWRCSAPAISPRTGVLASFTGGWPSVYFYELASGRRLGTLVPSEPPQYLSISADGHYRTPPGRGDDLVVYVAQTEHGQDTLSPDEFQKRYGWKNDRDKVRLVPEARTEAAQGEQGRRN